MKRSKSRSGPGCLLVPGIFLCLSVLVYLYTQQDPDLQKAGMFCALLMVGWMPPAWFSVFIHELGHYVAARRSNLPVSQIIVGPVVLSVEQGGIVFSATSGANILGGMVYVTPRETGDLRFRYRRFVAGGPIASLVLAAVAVGCTYLFGGSNIFVGLVLGTMSLFSILVLLGSILPTGIKGVHCDAWWFFTLRPGNPNGDAFIALLEILTVINLHEHPRNWPKERLDAAKLATRPADIVAQAHVYAAMHEWALGDKESARQAADVANAQLSKLLWPATRYNAVRTCAVIFAATGDVNLARQLLDEWGTHTPFDGFFLMAEACVMASEGRHDESLTTMRKAAIELAPLYFFQEMKEQLIDGLEVFSPELRQVAEEELGLRVNSS